jgi:hypothetical protein
MWFNASCSPIELRPAAPGALGLIAVLGLAGAAAVLAGAGAPVPVALPALGLPAGALAAALRRHRQVRAIRSTDPTRWQLDLADGRRLPAQLVRAWALGPWLAALTLQVPGRGQFGITLLARDQPPAAWRRLLVRLRVPSGS